MRELGEIAVGDSVTIRVTMTPERTGKLVNNVTVDSDEGDRDASDNTASASVQGKAAKTRFSLTKKAQDVRQNVLGETGADVL